MRLPKIQRLAIGLLCAVYASAAPAETRNFNVAAQAAMTAIREFARQAGVQIIAPADALAGLQTPALKGNFDTRDGLVQLIAGTGLEVASMDGGTIILRRARLTAVQGADLALSAQTNPGNRDIDIIVTAQRREEAISQTPVAVTAIRGERIAQEGVTTIDALENVTPSLTLNQGGQAATGGFRLRGIGTETFSGGIEPSVATFVDGIVVGRTTNVTNLQLIDLERVEVLRGPQGTLFGKNASAGVVNIVTKGPTSTFQAGGTATIAERNEYNVQAYISGPLSDRLSFRFTTFAAGQDGFVKNTVPDPSVLWAPLLVAQPNLLNGITLAKTDSFYKLRAFGLRGKLKYNSEALTSLLTIDYADSRGDCCARTFIEFYPNGAGLNRRLGGAQIGRQSVETAEDGLIATSDRSFSVIADNTLHLGGYDLISLTGFRRQDNASVEDQDYGTGPQITGSTAFFNKAEFDYRSVRTTQISQELRLQSPLRQALSSGLSYDFVLGGYYFHQNDDYGPGNTRIQIISNTTPALLWCSTQACRRDFVYNVFLRSENIAAFGQLNLHVGEQVTLFYGGRFTHDAIGYNWSSQDDRIAPFRQGTFTRSERGSKNNYSQRVGIEFQATRSSFLYASYAEGYKGPGFRTFERIGSEEFLQPERAKSYELGARFRFPEIRSFIGLTLYREDYRDLVVSGYDQALRVSRIFNAGQARSQGVEVDFTSRPVTSLSLSGGLAYSDNKYVSFPGTSCYPFQSAAQGCIFDPVANRTLQNLAGAPLQRAPAFKGNLSVRYDTPAIGGLRPFVLSNYRWISSQQMGGNNDPKTIQPAYGILDMSAGFTLNEGKIEVRAFVKNALDKFYAVNIFSTDNWLNQRVPKDYRRYFGMTLSARY